MKKLLKTWRERSIFDESLLQSLENWIKNYDSKTSTMEFQPAQQAPPIPPPSGSRGAPPPSYGGGGGGGGGQRGLGRREGVGDKR